MPNYNNSKIYKIYGMTHDFVYYGSTTQRLSKRLHAHKIDYYFFSEGKGRYVTSFEVINTDDYQIELVEKYPCNSKEDLHKREGFYIKNNKCVNKHIACQTRSEYYENNKESILEKCKEYRNKNKDKIKAYMDIYRATHKEARSTYDKTRYIENKESILKYQKEYRDANAEALAIKSSQYYENNKEEFLAKCKIYKEKNKAIISKKTNCECGGKYTHGSKARHFKSKKHIAFNSQE